MTATAPTHVEPAQDQLGAPFYTIWAGQFISAFGSMITAFSLSIWLYQATGSVLDFTGMVMCATLPALLLLPWTGRLADRANKRKILIGCDVGAALCAATIGLLALNESFEPLHLYILQGVMALCMAFQGPAAYVTINALVPKSQYGRASGMFSLSTAVTQLAAPLVAVSVLQLAGLEGVIAFDLLTFGAALLSLSVVALPATLLRPRDVASSTGSVGYQWQQAVAFFRERPVLGRVYAYTSLGGFLSGTVIALVAPMMLARFSPQELAYVTSSGALGGLLGGLALVVWGGPPRWTPRLLGFNLLAGLAVAVAGLTGEVKVLCACALVVMLSSTALSGCVQSVWRRKVPRPLQGSIAALQQAVAMGLVPLSAMVGGLLSHYVFEPALQAQGWAAPYVGGWFGTGHGQGTALFFVVIGVISAVVAAVSLADRRLATLEHEVPDAV